MEEQHDSKYKQIFDTLKEEILVGKYNLTRKLPSETQLVRRFHFSRPTVTRAMEELKRAGYLDRRPGSGTYLSPSARVSSGLIGMIVPDYSSGEIFTPICAEFAAHCQEAGYTLLFGNASAPELEERAEQSLALADRYIKQGVAGVIFEPIEFVSNFQSVNAKIISLLNVHKIPVILFDRDLVPTPDRSHYDLVGIDNLNAGNRLARHLIGQGAKRIYFFSRPDSAPTVQQRIAGVHHALLQANLHWSAKHIRTGDPENADCIERILKSGQPPDAIICSNDLIAARFMQTLSRLGVSVPRDILLAAFDDVQYASLVTPPLTTIHQPCKEIGRIAAQTLLQRIREPKLPPREILLDAPLVVRASTTR